jgi:hypothetical protein
LVSKKLPGIRLVDIDFDLIAFLEFKRSDHSGRKADGETVSPFSDPHAGTICNEEGDALC